MLAPWMKFVVMEEANDGASGGGGGGETIDLNVNIDAASDAIGADLGLNDGEGTDELLDGSATPPAKKEAVAPAAKVPPEGETPEVKAAREAREKAAAAGAKPAPKPGDSDYKAPESKAAPKAWPKEKHEIYSKLPPEAQAYIDQREAEIENGFKAQGEETRYAKGIKEVMQPYEALLTAQGVKDHGAAVKAVMNAHYILSTNPPEKKAEFMAKLARNYGVDLTKALEAWNADPASQETQAQRETRERLERLENERHNEKSQQFAALKAQSAAEVEAFASDPAHPYFQDVAPQVALLLQDPSITLEKAYEMAVYANPVTRAKELARLETEAKEKARKESEEAAAAAEKARGTKVRGKEEERASPDILGSMEDTMRETYKKIQTRQE